MRRLIFIMVTLIVVTTATWAQQAKYVFYFIGDGMGVNQVNCTEMYLAETKGKIGIEPLLFTQFPIASIATTYSASNGVTDSAASGTALATGQKTTNGALGMDASLTKPVYSIATAAQAQGKKVGVCTTVSPDHATPAAFYAHQPKRSSYYEIGLDMIKARFDYYGGSDLLQPTSKKDAGAPNLFSLLDKAGFTVARGYKDYQAKSSQAKNMVLLQPADEPNKSALKYAIDQTDNDMKLADLTRAGIDFLSKDNKKGFFLMVEGGKIDHAGHGNDGAAMVHEVIDFDNAIKVAYEFYKKHPKETLIVVTADHETGGLVIGNGSYTLNLKALNAQKVSQDHFTLILQDLRKKNKNQVSWEMIEQTLKDNFGFGDAIKLTQKEKAELKKVYDESFGNKDAQMDENMYAKNEPLTAIARHILNDHATLSWAHYSHSAGYVPVFAVGAGSELFIGKTDNAEIPVKIAKAAGYKFSNK